MVDFKHGCLRFEGEEMKTFEACKSRRRLRAVHGGWKPAHAQQLNRMWEGLFAVAKVKADRMNSVRVDDSEVVSKRCLGA